MTAMRSGQGARDRRPASARQYLGHRIDHRLGGEEIVALAVVHVNVAVEGQHPSVFMVDALVRAHPGLRTRRGMPRTSTGCST